MPSKAQKRAAEKQRYAERKKQEVLEERKIRYRLNSEREKIYSQQYSPQHKRLHSRTIYNNDADGKKKEASKEASRRSYKVNPNKKKEASKEASRKLYKEKPYMIKQKVKARYYRNREQKCAVSRHYYNKYRRMISTKRKQWHSLKVKLTGAKKLEVLNNFKKAFGNSKVLKARLRARKHKPALASHKGNKLKVTTTMSNRRTF